MAGSLQTDILFLVLSHMCMDRLEDRLMLRLDPGNWATRWFTKYFHASNGEVMIEMRCFRGCHCLTFEFCRFW